MNNLLKFINENFMHVAPILAIGAAGVVITLERASALMFKYPLLRQRAFFEKIRSLVMNERISEAIAFCERYSAKPAASVVKEGLLRAHQPESVIAHGLEIAVSEAQQRVLARTGYLATIANVATLLGLLGTILGLIQSFEAVGSANAQQRSQLLAAGISTAMNATMLGLGVAIPAMIAFSFLMNRSNRINAEIERAAVRILDYIEQRYFGSGAKPPHGGGEDPSRLVERRDQMYRGARS
jgi:biopolymer transport protein ExbB